MQITPQIAVYVLLLLPGLLGHAVFSAFTYTEKPTWSGRTVVAIVLSGAAYLTLAILRIVPVLDWLPDPQALIAAADHGLAGALSPDNILCVVLASVLAFVYSIGLVCSHNHRTLHRLANKLCLTTKSGYVNEWDSVMIEQARTRWVLISMKDGTSFVGWLRSHDVSSPDRCIVLEKVRQQDKEDNGLEWPERELLVINSMADVRFLRLIPNQEVPRDQPAREQRAAALPEHRDEVREPKPQPTAAGAATSGPDAAHFIAGEAEQVTNGQPRKEHQNV